MKIPGLYFELGHYLFLLSPLYLFIHLLCYPPTLYNIDTASQNDPQKIKIALCYFYCCGRLFPYRAYNGSGAPTVSYRMSVGLYFLSGTLGRKFRLTPYLNLVPSLEILGALIYCVLYVPIEQLYRSYLIFLNNTLFIK
jgi:hypothetical protein